MDLQFDLPKMKSSIIKVIGVGGGGCNAVNHMYNQGIKGVEFAVCNTDAQSLELSVVPNKMQLGAHLTEGRGAGSCPEVGMKAAIENIDEIKKLLGDHTKMVFITAGMGGGTGTGAAPIIAKTAKEMGILTVGIVTTPFNFEGIKRKNKAHDGIDSLQECVDTLLVISNEKLREIHGNLPLSVAFSHADDILTVASKGIAEIITVPGYINVDFEDVKTVMSNSGVAIMGSASAEGEERAKKAVEKAIKSPLLNDNDIQGAKYILLNITSGTKEILMDEISIITDFIQEEAGQEADMIWGHCYDETLGEKISVTIIATAFEAQTSANGKTAEEKIVTPLELNPEKIQPYINSLSKDKANLKELPPINRTPTTQMNIFDMPVQPKAVQKESHFVLEEENKVEMEEENGDVNEPELTQAFDEKRSKLKSLSFNPKNAEYDSLEREPAYRRKNIKLRTTIPSSESEISRYTLSDEKEEKPAIRNTNNGYLHDNVD